MSAMIPANVPSSGVPGSPQAPRGTGQGVVSHGWLAAESTYGLADTRKMGGALSGSVGLHGIAVLIGLLVAALRPPIAVPANTPPEHYDLVFVQMVGPGGGGGGNSSPEPPSKVEMQAELPEVPVIEPVEIDTPAPSPSLVAPVRMTAVIDTPGTFTGLSAAPSAGPGGGTGTGKGTGRGSGIGPGYGGGFGGGAMRPGSGVENPTILRKVEPEYTTGAMRAKIQGVVELEAVVGIDGVITGIRVRRSLDRAFGLDEEAIRTVKLWRFHPGRFQGEPVAVLVTIELTFNLR